MLRRCSSVIAGSLAVLLLCASNSVYCYDLSSLTELAAGALVGETVGQPVSGFEVRLLQDGELLYHQVFGDWSLNRPANVDSATKTLSGALIMSLAESGESGFSLDSHLSDFLAEYDRPGYRDISIRQAFSHSSGLPGEDVGSPILLNPFITLRQAAFQISQQPLDNAPPGSRFAYGGLSMQAAGAAAEVATGESYVDLFAERITTPLQMTSTQFVLASDSNPRVAGGIESTATDFSRFMDTLLNGGVDRVTGTRLLTSDSVAEMLARQTTDDQIIVNSPAGNNRYGVGVWLDQLMQAGPPVDALAAGARGFHSWIDEPYGLVMTFATEETVFSNIEQLSSLMHLAILQAVAAPGDFNFDGVVDGADLLAWQRGDSPDPVSIGDLAAWQANYGVGAIQWLRVPEPTNGIMLLLAGFVSASLVTTR